MKSGFREVFGLFLFLSPTLSEGVGVASVSPTRQRYF